MSPSNNNRAPLLERLDTLPAIPKIAHEIMALKINTQAGEQALLKLISNDPVIAGRLIGMANASVFGGTRKIASLNDAITLLGIRRVKMTALGIAMMTSMMRKPPGELDTNQLWLHSLTVKIAMQTLADHMPPDLRPLDEDTILAGLLHDVGFLVLDFIDPALSDALHKRWKEKPARPIEQIEAELLDMNHTELGAELARRWGLPANIATVLRYHHQPGDPNAAGQPLVRMAHLAGNLLPAFELAEQIHTDVTPEEWQALGIDPASAEKIIERIRKEASELAGAFS